LDALPYVQVARSLFRSAETPNRGKPKKLRRRVLQLIQKKYSGSEEERFGPTLVAEHLAEEDGITIDTRHCGAGRWLKGYGVGNENRKKHYERRDCKAHFGELVQLDGSFHIRWKARTTPWSDEHGG
jgi:hypothetical protein